MDRPLHILQINNRIPWPLNDGGNIATWNVTNELHRQGHEVTFAALNTTKHHQDPAVMAAICDIHSVDIDTRVTPGGLLMGLVQKMPYNVKRFSSEIFAEALQRLLRHQTVDVIQTEGIYMGLYLETMREVSKAPIILRAHNVEHQIWERLAAGEKSPLKRGYLKQLARKISAFESETFPKYDGIIAITQEDAGYFASKGYKGRLTAIPAGVDGNRFRPTDTAVPSGRVAFLGSLEWRPNVEGLRWLLDHIWPAVHAQVPGSELHVAGKNPPAEVKGWAATGMTMHGEVPDAAAYLQTCGILAVPLLSGGGMRLKIVEAMAAGLCVVTTTVGAEGIHCEPGRDILVADGVEGFRNELLKACANPALAVQVGKAARETALREYGWPGLVGRFVKFYREVISVRNA